MSYEEIQQLKDTLEMGRSLIAAHYKDDQKALEMFETSLRIVGALEEEKNWASKDLKLVFDRLIFGRPTNSEIPSDGVLASKVKAINDLLMDGK